MVLSPDQLQTLVTKAALVKDLVSTYQAMQGGVMAALGRDTPASRTTVAIITALLDSIHEDVRPSPAP